MNDPALRLDDDELSRNCAVACAHPTEMSPWAKAAAKRIIRECRAQGVEIVAASGGKKRTVMTHGNGKMPCAVKVSPAA